MDDGDGDRLRQRRRGRGDEAGQRAERGNDRAGGGVMVAVIVVAVVGVARIVADDLREHAPFDAVVGVTVRGRQRFAQIEGQMDRYECVERQRQNAGACRPPDALPFARNHPESTPVPPLTVESGDRTGNSIVCHVADRWSQVRLDPGGRAVRARLWARRRGRAMPFDPTESGGERRGRAPSRTPALA